ncbi:MAG TPA: HEAT repeat domain-containing protein [Gemmataceae bacterium]|nr:HEAT repeat domain-containing protein [Gemmataceae bacterium]
MPRIVFPVVTCLALLPVTVRGQDDDPMVAGKKKSEWLKIIVEDKSPRQREAAVVAFMLLPNRDRKVIDAVREALLGDKAERVRVKALDAAALFILTELREPPGLVEAIGKALVNDSAEEVRLKALDTIKGALKKDEQQKKIVPYLSDSMKGDQVAAVRAAIAEALGRVGDEARGAILRLIPMLKDEDAGVRLAAAFALGRIGPEAATAVPDLAQTLATDTDALVRKEAARAFALLGYDAKAGIPALVKALREDKSEEVRQQTALALGKMRGEDLSEFAPAMVEVIKNDKDKNVRIFLVHSLGNSLGDGLRAYVKELADQLIKDPEGDVRLTIVQELGALGPAAKEALPALKRALTDVQLSVRDAAKAAVKKVQEQQ